MATQQTAQKPQQDVQPSPAESQPGASAASPSKENPSPLDQVRLLLDGQHYERALHLAHKHERALEMKNAMGVCYMRQGKLDKAIQLYRKLALSPGDVNLKSDVPERYHVNFATALLVSGNVSGCQSILRQLKDRQSPSVQRVQGAIDRWKKSLSFWQRLNLALSGEPKTPVELDFPPGEL